VNFNPLDQDLDFGARAFAQGPVDGHAVTNFGDKFGGDDFKIVACSRRLSELPITSMALLLAAKAS
jgi:hypothetical protein